MTIRTWYFETAFVAAVLVGITVLTATRPIDWLACAAVFLTFRHAQIADRMSEAQGAMPVPAVHCFRLATRYWILKELCWLAFFILQGSYAAVAGAVLFALYPAWRRFWRTVHPRAV